MNVMNGGNNSVSLACLTLSTLYIFLLIEKDLMKFPTGIHLKRKKFTAVIFTPLKIQLKNSI